MEVVFETRALRDRSSKSDGIIQNAILTARNLDLSELNSYIEEYPTGTIGEILKRRVHAFSKELNGIEYPQTYNAQNRRLNGVLQTLLNPNDKFLADKTVGSEGDFINFMRRYTIAVNLAINPDLYEEVVEKSMTSKLAVTLDRIDFDKFHTENFQTELLGNAAISLLVFQDRYEYREFMSNIMGVDTSAPDNVSEYIEKKIFAANEHERRNSIFRRSLTKLAGMFSIKRKKTKAQNEETNQSTINNLIIGDDGEVIGMNLISNSSDDNTLTIAELTHTPHKISEHGLIEIRQFQQRVSDIMRKIENRFK